MFYGVGVLLNALWFYTIKDWQIILASIYLIPCLAVLLAVLIIVKDTPFSAILRNTPYKVYQNLTYIAKLNQKDNSSLTVAEISNIK